MESHNVSFMKLAMANMASNSAVLNFRYHTKQLRKSTAGLTNSCMVNSGCLLVKGRHIHYVNDYPIDQEHLTSFRNKPQQKQPEYLSVPIPA